jgi:type II secretory pathway component GspD/PulD (secretin)
VAGALKSLRGLGVNGLAMKTKSILLLAMMLAFGCSKTAAPKTFSSFDKPTTADAPVAPHGIRFQDADLTQVLAIYQDLSGRSVILSPRVPTGIKITFDNATPLSRVETLQAIDNLMAAQGIVMVYLGNKFVKVVSAAEVPSESGPVIDLPPDQLPDSSSFLTYIVTLRKLKPEQATPVLQPFAKLPNSIIGVRGSDVLILRDYSSNVRRMLEVLEKAEANVPSPGPVQRVLNAFAETNAGPPKPRRP